MDAALEAMHTWKYALLRWRINNKHFSESLEQLASYNGADMYKYNMIYTFKINQDVLPPESYYTKKREPIRFSLRSAQNRNRTSDTRIFSPLLYRLSYLGLQIE